MIQLRKISWLASKWILENTALDIDIKLNNLSPWMFNYISQFLNLKLFQSQFSKNRFLKACAHLINATSKQLFIFK